MEAAEVRQRTALLSSGDSQITEALDLLESRLEEWLEALREGQRLFEAGELWRKAEQAASAEAKPTPLIERGAESLEPGAEGAESGALLAAGAAEAQAAEGAESEGLIEAEAAAPEAAGVESALVAAGAETETEAGVVQDAGVAAGEAGEESQGSAVDEDEALLATLDPELAAAIRVKRRLGHKKSVRELLADLEKQGSRSKDKRRGKGGKKWWR